MNDPPPLDNRLIEEAAGGDPSALAIVFEQYRHRLKKMVWLRLDRRLQGRIDPSDVVQEAFLDLANELPAYAEKRSIPLFLWMRLVTGQRLMRLHRKHLNAEMRDANREVSIYDDRMPLANSDSMASKLLDDDTSASGAAIRSEVQQQLRGALNDMDPIDREIIALRHFEQLENVEAAAVLGLSVSAASKRHVRALKRLQEILSVIPGLIDDQR
jgi:RNA polymerase sigma-70 factor (ECF subfamily)